MQTFAGWFTLPENRSARTAMERVARRIRRRRSAASTLNPLVLHGPAGTGKTHLAHALLANVTQAIPDLTVTVLAAREFAVAGSDLSCQTEARSAELIVIEDLQHLPAVAAEAFVELVDRCRAQGRQLVVTANVGPAQIKHLPTRVTSRLSAGLVVRLRRLSASSRLAFLRQRVERRGQVVAAGVLEWLADHLPGSVRQLKSALVRLEALSRMTNQPIGPEMLATHFRADVEARRLTVEQIAQRVGHYFQVAPGQMQARDRGRNALLPRQVGMYLARRLTQLSLGQIGSYFGGRDHSTVLHACRKVEKALTHNAALSGAVQQLQADLA